MNFSVGSIVSFMKVMALKLTAFYKVKITMQVNLSHIIVFNFKSFKGEVIIGPIKPFTAIIGANGSGKFYLFQYFR